MTRSPRDHGYGDRPTVVGAPVIGARVPAGSCPHCRCATVFEVEVEVGNPSPRLRRPMEPHRVLGRYIGCPACPWASPMVTLCVPTTTQGVES